MLVRELMTQDVECARPNDTLQEAAEKMRDFDIGLLPVCGDNDRLVGMLTDRDITVRAAAEGLDPWTCRTRDVMTPNVIYCMEDQDVAEAAQLMKDNQIRRLVVLDRNKLLVGIVSLGDLAVESGNEQLVGNALEAVSEPAMPRR
jgi:CBS domain-containing protein